MKSNINIIETFHKQGASLLECAKRDVALLTEIPQCLYYAYNSGLACAYTVAREALDDPSNWEMEGLDDFHDQYFDELRAICKVAEVKPHG